MGADPGNAGAHPVNPQSWNAYTYVINNPLNAVDPDGLDYNLIGGDRCGKDIQCDKDGFVTDDKGNRVVVTDEDFLNGTNGVTGSFDPETGKATITTALGTFEGSFFDPNPLSITVSPTFEEQKFMALETAGAMAEPGVNAAMALTAPNFFVAGGASVALPGQAAVAETTILPSTLNHLIGPFQRELLIQFFRSRGGSVPEGLSSESLKFYAEIAKRAIAEGKDELGVQAMRLKWIAEALKRK